jgi:hypothetical protein
MIQTKKGLFQIVIESNNEPVKDIKSKEEKTYLCVESGQPFTIKLIATQDPQTVYGARLYIDEKEMAWMKTFKRFGNFFGKKLGNGKYAQFIFDEPLHYDSLSIDRKKRERFLNTPEAAKTGSIKVEFFTTNQIISKKKLKTLKKKCEYEQSYRKDDKKFFVKSMTVREGNVFEINNTYKDFLDKYEGNTIKEDFVDFSKKIDEITVYYADFISLQVMGIVIILFYFIFRLI